ncbi:universal stress protein [Paenibacillus macquariensis]|uniref:Two-component system, OmpR family, sensor histidine kinase KdpD n=1 Tax=Paenibacillus macquariensis TaxID=948756 RepID=A0ABY1K981_9BACL|nr:universal stress protein [Paenibacillus macquariensis]MEC0091562.1 universal stress protein [Paenibacillus macquariensis]OAB26689.1 histidine kinase [Paenibacillus macquariensis subsp. macquariensis]SIR44680.1 two-component system, OmpR family, sensor histidine kinase KdpD [Paenibacillus macquariensis]
METFKRKTPEEILMSIYKLHRGRLEILIGAVSGSGKTYHMLREGQLLKQQGIDVVICAVTTSQRSETVEQLADLERVPSIHWMKNGIEQKDLNIDVLLERNPEVVLVDAIAHRNRPNARFMTRLEDIQHLLSQGISVITTANIYDLEGVREVASRMTGIEVKETVPANTLSLADEVRLIDVTPETLLSRIATGKFQLSQAETDLVFKRGNIAILRELALRHVAEGVNDSLEKHNDEMGNFGPTGVTEKILVSAQYHWNSSIYVRRGQQIAKRLNGDLCVISFRNPQDKMSREAETFKRSLVKLVKKVNGEFEELPFSSRRALPNILVKYAMEHRATRIVLGHSKQTLWQECWQGSIIHDILKKTRNVDVFVIADRAEHEGERILPTKLKGPEESSLYRRLSSEEVDQQIERIKRGQFKVYIGSAPGVGKTYTMLREGNDLERIGTNVTIGLLETHGRKETGAQVGSLGTIPRKIIDYRGARLEEMDTEEIIRQAPDVVLVDELAHTNVPGSKNKKRFEDVIEILNAGISVITTMNVQHLESLNDAVEQITGVRVRETVPDHILHLADEVQLIDVAPQSLQQRIREGKVYALDKVEQSLGNFFKTGNLIALRELALREIADDVDERLESWQRTSSLRGPWRREEVIYVCVELTAHAESLIRRGFRIAHRLKATWYVTYVQLEDTETKEEDSVRIEALEKLTERLGGHFNILQARRRAHIATVLITQANEHKVTQIIVGQSKLGFIQVIRKGSVVKRLLRAARHVDVLVVARF